MGELTKRMPWDPAPVEETLGALQRDVAYMVTHTAVMVHSNRPELTMLVNTPRGQLVPRSVATFEDGTTIEFQDVGMPQPKAPHMSVEALVAQVMGVVRDLGLGLPK